MMPQDNNMFGGVLGTIVSAVGASMSISEIQSIISIIVTVLGFLITVVSTVIIPLIVKYKRAKADGKITAEELEDMNDTFKESIEKIKNSGK